MTEQIPPSQQIDRASVTWPSLTNEPLSTAFGLAQWHSVKVLELLSTLFVIDATVDDRVLLLSSVPSPIHLQNAVWIAI